MKRNDWAGRLLICAGFVLLVAAAGLVGYNLWDTRRATDLSGQVLEELAPVLAAEEADGTSAAVEDHVLAPEIAMPERLVDGVGYIGVLEIPELELCLPIAGEWDYVRLKNSPCRYTGSVYTEDFVIAGHNYVGHFGYLSRLRLDSEILFTDLDGNTFRYAVVELETLQPQAVEEMTSGTADLTLFTCTVGGRSRLAVRADLVE